MSFNELERDVMNAVSLSRAIMTRLEQRTRLKIDPIRPIIVWARSWIRIGRFKLRAWFWAQWKRQKCALARLRRPRKQRKNCAPAPIGSPMQVAIGSALFQPIEQQSKRLQVAPIAYANGTCDANLAWKSSANKRSTCKITQSKLTESQFVRLSFL